MENNNIYVVEIYKNHSYVGELIYIYFFVFFYKKMPNIFMANFGLTKLNTHDEMAKMVY